MNDTPSKPWSTYALSLALLPALVSAAAADTLQVASSSVVVAAARQLNEVCPASVDALPTSPLFHRRDPRLRADHVVVVRKNVRRIMVYSAGTLVPGSCVPMALGIGSPRGPKRVEGDRKTPEGWYRTSNDPHSSWYHAISIHYPNERDAAHGLVAGRISRRTYRRIVSALKRGRKPPQTTALGGLILIHGGGTAGSKDWTLGCVGMTNAHIDKLRSKLPRSKRAHILIVP